VGGDYLWDGVMDCDWGNRVMTKLPNCCQPRGRAWMMRSTAIQDAQAEAVWMVRRPLGGQKSIAMRRCSRGGRWSSGGEGCLHVIQDFGAASICKVKNQAGGVDGFINFPPSALENELSAA